MSDMDQSQYDAEVRERWGDTEAYRESSKRTTKYSDADWVRIKGEAESIEAGFADAMTAGAPADGELATDLAEAARGHIDRWYYPCSHAMHAGLADMYTSDARFKAHYDDRADGLAEYVATAIRANVARREE